MLPYVSCQLGYRELLACRDSCAVEQQDGYRRQCGDHHRLQSVGWGVQQSVKPKSHVVRRELCLCSRQVALVPAGASFA
jgi:hypothetical protein